MIKVRTGEMNEVRIPEKAVLQGEVLKDPVRGEPGWEETFHGSK